MKLPTPGPRYDPQRQAQTHRALELEDEKNRKRGQHVELGPDEALILRSPDGTRWKLLVDNLGALSTVQL
jgi:hypothetical protein